MKLSRWILLGALCYLLFAVARFPASVAINWLAPAGATISGVSGTAWNGQAAVVTTDAVTLSEVKWSLNAWKFLLLKASADVNAKVPGGAIRTEVNSSLFGNSGEARELRGVVKLAQLSETLQLPLTLTGNAGLRFDKLGWTDGTLTAADGEIQLADVTEPTSATALGSFSVMFASDEDRIIGTFSDTEAIFKLGGTLNLNPDRTYTMETTIEPTRDTPAAIGTAVGMIGATKDSSGNYVLSSSGSY